MKIIFDNFFQIDGPFWCPTTICITSKNDDDQCEDFPLPEGAKYPFNFTNSQALVHEADHVRKCLQEGVTESPLLTLDESVHRRPQVNLVDYFGIGKFVYKKLKD